MISFTTANIAANEVSKVEQYRENYYNNNGSGNRQLLKELEQTNRKRFDAKLINEIFSQIESVEDKVFSECNNWMNYNVDLQEINSAENDYSFLEV